MTAGQDRAQLPPNRHPTPSPAGSPSHTPGGRLTNVSAYATSHIVKPAPWTWMISTYFFFGGLAGMSATLSLAARIAGHRRLADRALLASVIGYLPCGPLLIFDLGKPSRFYNMLRVFRPTSPMSVGTWIFSAFSGALGISVAGRLFGLFRPFEMLARTAAGLIGPALSTYTAVLITNTSVPAWQAARREMPFLFGAGAAASAGAATTLLANPKDAGPARTLAIGAALLETGLSELIPRRIGSVGSTYSGGVSGNLHQVSTICNLGGAGLLAVLGRRRPAAITGASLVLAGACLERFAVVKAGDASANLT